VGIENMGKSSKSALPGKVKVMLTWGKTTTNSRQAQARRLENAGKKQR